MKLTMVPVFRIFDLSKAKEFYCNFLDWKIDWTHTFGENFPVYMQVSDGSHVIHLSEHHGDACPGATVRVYVDDIEALHARLITKDYKYAKPSIEVKPWKTKEMYINDPFGNKLMFTQDLG